MKQAYNPFLPLNVYIPDGEPHVFGDRVYLFGSHEEEGGKAFCTLGYEFFSAPLNDLTDWTSKGINYEAKQDPEYGKTGNCMYAPDVVRGNDGRYYLYYALSGGTLFTAPIHVAVCDTPDGKYEYYGEVRNPDGTPFMRKITFDPAVLNDGGKIRLYYGWSLAAHREDIERAQQAGRIKDYASVQAMFFGKSKEEIEGEPGGIMGAFTVELAEDMLTVKSEPRLVVPGAFDADGTSFEGHAFFEGSSIRKVGETYYFIYSSEHQHELCYATSRFPDRDFVYGGVLISNGDIGLGGRKDEDRLAATGNNHGSMQKLGEQWYIFYHRQTHGTSFSRQACAEVLDWQGKGPIPQAEMTSCGLNGGPLKAEGEYPAVICCNLTNSKMPHIDSRLTYPEIPRVTSDGKDRFVGNLTQNTQIVYKYFAFRGAYELTLTVRGGAGAFEVFAGEEQCANVSFSASQTWQKVACSFSAYGTKPLRLVFRGKEPCDLLSFSFGSTAEVTMDGFLRAIALPEPLRAEVEAVLKQTDLAPLEEDLQGMMEQEHPFESFLSLLQKQGKDERAIGILSLQLECARRDRARYLARGIGEDIYLATMACFCRFAEEYRRKHGVYGFDCPWWAYRQLNMSIFRLGVLEFEFGERKIDLHIPSDADFSPASVQRSLAACRAFCRRFFPAYENAPMGTRSWLLSPAITPFLKEGSNILAFQRLFEVKELFPDDPFIGHLFGVDEKTPVEKLPEKTSLQRGVKALIKEGVKVGAAYGVLKEKV